MVIQHHKEVCNNTIGHLAYFVWNRVIREPIVREANSEAGTPALVADLAVHGVWTPQTEALFDTSVTDTDT